MVESVLLAVEGAGKDTVQVDLPRSPLHLGAEYLAILHHQEVSLALEGTAQDLHYVLTKNTATLDFRGG